MMLGRRIRRDEKGIGSVEFALVTPALVALVAGTVQMGLLFYTKADMRHAVAAGARAASVFPRPSDTAIIGKIKADAAGLKQSQITTLTVTPGKDANDRDYWEIEMGYKVPLDFVLYRLGDVTLTEKRRVFVQPAS